MHPTPSLSSLLLVLLPPTLQGKNSALFPLHFEVPITLTARFRPQEGGQRFVFREASQCRSKGTHLATRRCLPLAGHMGASLPHLGLSLLT